MKVNPRLLGFGFIAMGAITSLMFLFVYETISDDLFADNVVPWLLWLGVGTSSAILVVITYAPRKPADFVILLGLPVIPFLMLLMQVLDRDIWIDAESFNGSVRIGIVLWLAVPFIVCWLRSGRRQGFSKINSHGFSDDDRG